ERIRRFAAAYLASFIDHEPGLSVTLRELQGLPPELIDTISHVHHDAATRRIEEILADGVARGLFFGVDAHAAAYAILGMLQGFIRLHTRNPGSIAREQAEAQIGYFYAGLLST